MLYYALVSPIGIQVKLGATVRIQAELGATVGYCPVGLPTYNWQRPSRQSTGPNAKKSKTN